MGLWPNITRLEEFEYVNKQVAESSCGHEDPPMNLLISHWAKCDRLRQADKY